MFSGIIFVQRRKVLRDLAALIGKYWKNPEQKLTGRVSYSFEDFIFPSHHLIQNVIKYTLVIFIPVSTTDLMNNNNEV